jgi:capsular exopolysaccharide synthesis family protein
MSAEQIAGALWRRKLLFIVAFLACLAAIVVVTVSLPKAYKATATLYVGDEQSNKALEFNSTLGETLTRTYSTLAGNPNVADQVLQELPLNLSRTELLKRMSFAPVERTQLLQIGAEGGSPSEARLIANTYATVFTQRVKDQFDAGRTQSKVSINEPAVLPSSAFKPNPTLYIGIGVLLSLLLAIGAVLVRERLDKTLKISEEDDSVLGNPIIGRIPQVSGPMAYAAPDLADAFRLLKTTLDFHGERPARLLMITSPAPVEGKTSVATHLALADAADGEKVVLIEADLRRPGLAATLVASGAVRSEVGLTNYLVSSASEDEILVPHPQFPNLHVIWSGPTPPNPTTLLRSEQLATLLHSLQTRYDRIIVDTPPVSVGADASVIASRVDSVVYVIDATKTSRTAARAGLNQLANVHANVVGIVVNKTAVTSFRAYYPAPGGFEIQAASSAPASAAPPESRRSGRLRV